MLRPCGRAVFSAPPGAPSLKVGAEERPQPGWEPDVKPCGRVVGLEGGRGRSLDIEEAHVSGRTPKAPSPL